MCDFEGWDVIFETARTGPTDGEGGELETDREPVHPEMERNSIDGN